MLKRDQNWHRRLRRNLRRWYDGNARDLPWRRTSDPYRIWISEIMLQQTTVAAVVPYFERFLERFPTVDALAAVAEDDVLRQWEGLGYYSRARNIHKTARRIVDEHAGRFPDEVAALVELPGIGRYTAGAIASFAFDRRAPIVEANTLRVYSRLLGYRGDPRSAEGQKLLWEFAERILPRQSPGRFNHALMELGATLCSPVAPRCPECPVRTCCRAFAEGAQNEIPRPARRPAITDVTEATVAVRKDGRYLLRRRGPGERWAGLWDFPRFPLEGVGEMPVHNGRPQREHNAKLACSSPTRSRRPSANGKLTNLPAIRRTLEAAVAEQTGVAVEIGDLLTELRHGVTRFRIRLLCFLAEHRSGRIRRNGEFRWVRPREFEHYPLSVTGRELARMLAELQRAPSVHSDTILQS